MLPRWRRRVRAGPGQSVWALAVSTEFLLGLFVLSDVSAVIVANDVANRLLLVEDPPLAAAKALLPVGLIVGLPGVLYFSGLYRLSSILRPSRRSGFVLFGALVACAVLVGPAPLSVSPQSWALGLTTLSVITCATFRTVFGQLLRHCIRHGKKERDMTVSQRGRERALRLERSFEDSKPWPDAGPRFGDVPRLDDAGDLIASVRAALSDKVLRAVPAVSERPHSRKFAQSTALPMILLAHAAEPQARSAQIPARVGFRGLSPGQVRPRPGAGWSRGLKAAIDFSLAVVLFVLLVPVLALIGALVKLDSPGPVFFRQKRHGLNRREFEIWKFRTMYHQDLPENDVRQCARNDSRVTPLGRFLRRTSLDELPQIFNVLNGTMSLVGPRPHALCHNREYAKLIPNYERRHSVKPGITGWAQVNGLRGETATVEMMARRVEHDIYYVDHWSLAFDLSILLVTPFVILFQKAAY